MQLPSQRSDRYAGRLASPGSFVYLFPAAGAPSRI